MSGPTAEVDAILSRASAAGRITALEAAELRQRLGCLALNLTAAGRVEVVSKAAAAAWLFRIRRRKLSRAPTAPLAEQERAARIWRLGAMLGFLSDAGGEVGFTSPSLRVYLCLDLCRSQPVDARLLRLIGRPAFGDVWRLWAQADDHVIHRVIAVLRTSSNPTIRYRAASVLAYIADARALDALLAALDDRSGGVRIMAADALGRIGDPQAIEPLLNVLRRDYVPMRHAVADALILFGEPAVLPLINVLEDEQNVVRRCAVKALGALGDPRAVDPLIRLLTSEKDHVLAVRTALALASLGKPAVPPLIALLKRPAKRANTALALGSIGDSRAIAPLFAALKQSRRDGQGAHDRHRIGNALTRLADKDTIPIFLRALRDKDGEVRRWAAAAVGQKGNHLALGPLCAALQDVDPVVRASAAEALGKLGDDQALTPLIYALGDPDPSARASAATALGTVGGDRAVEALIAALHDPRNTVREAAIWSLGRLGDRRAVEPLIAALAEMPDLRSAIITVLGTLGDPRAVEPIAQLLQQLLHNSERWWVCGAAVRTLANLGDRRAVEPLLRLVQETPPSDDIGRHHYWFVRSCAIEALGQLGDPRAVEPLIAILDGSEPDGRRYLVPVRAADALGRIGDRRALPALARVRRPYVAGDYYRYHYSRLINVAATRAMNDIRRQQSSRPK